MLTGCHFTLSKTLKQDNKQNTMASLLGFARRNWQMSSPPVAPEKTEKPLRFGVLGAANIG
jgi:hypothetical protein